MLHVIIPEFISEKDALFKKDTFTAKTYNYLDRLSSIVVIVNDVQYILEVVFVENGDNLGIVDLMNIKEPVDITLNHYCGNVFTISDIKLNTFDKGDTIEPSEEIDLVKTDSDVQIESEPTQTTDNKQDKRCHGTSGPSHQLKKITF